MSGSPVSAATDGVRACNRRFRCFRISIELSAVESAGLWALLEQARQAGVRFVQVAAASVAKSCG